MTIHSDVSPVLRWTAVCSADRLIPDRPVCALVEAIPVGIVLTSFDELFAFSSIDPFSSANVLWRGIVGSVDGRPSIASPMYKQRFLLESGACVDDPSKSVAVFAVRKRNGAVEIGCA